MKLNEILKGSAYDLAVFNKYPHHITELEESISIRKKRGKNLPFVTCYIRNNEIELKPEEVIRQLYLRVLVNEYGYPKSRIRLEYTINLGRRKVRVDIAISDKKNPNAEYILIELKSPKYKDGKNQLQSYCNGTGAPLGVWTNGEIIEYFHRTDPNYFNDLEDIPHSNQSLTDFLNRSFTILDLILTDKLRQKTLKNVVLELEDAVLANAGVNIFEESFKLIFTKLYDELLSAKDMDRLQYFIEDNDRINDIYDFERKDDRRLKLKKQNQYKEAYGKLNKKLRKLEFTRAGTEIEVEERIGKLFEAAQTKWQGIFKEGTTFGLSRSHLKVCVTYLENIKLFNSNLDIVDDAFEYLINKDNKGEKGQYFTPRYVIDMCVKMLNPKFEEYLIDSAAGSCGFPMHAIFHVWRKLNPHQNHLFTLTQKEGQQKEYVEDKVFAIDFDSRAVRVGKTLNLIAGDGKTNVLKLNALDFERWNENRSTDEWMDDFGKGMKNLEKLRADKNKTEGKRNYRHFNFDIVMANPPFAGDIRDGRILDKYDLAYKVLLSKVSEHKAQTGEFIDMSVENPTFPFLLGLAGETIVKYPDNTYRKVKIRSNKKMSRDILFIERNLDLLKPGGRMAVVLPQGRFNNASDKNLREYIAEHCRILAVVGLHGNTFKPHTGTKTSVLFLQKWTKWDESINKGIEDKRKWKPYCSRKEDYNIFFATQQEPAKDNSGDIIYVKHKVATLYDIKSDTVEEIDYIPTFVDKYDDTKKAIWYEYTEEDGRKEMSLFDIEKLHGEDWEEKLKNKDLKLIRDVSIEERKKMDTHGHFIVKHDLFNHGRFVLDDGTVINEGETQDGITEAFVEFAKKEKLSFWVGK